MCLKPKKMSEVQTSLTGRRTDRRKPKEEVNNLNWYMLILNTFQSDQWETLGRVYYTEMSTRLSKDSATA